MDGWNDGWNDEWVLQGATVQIDSVFDRVPQWTLKEKQRNSSVVTLLVEVFKDWVNNGTTKILTGSFRYHETWYSRLLSTYVWMWLSKLSEQLLPPFVNSKYLLKGFPVLVFLRHAYNRFIWCKKAQVAEKRWVSDIKAWLPPSLESSPPGMLNKPPNKNHSNHHWCVKMDAACWPGSLLTAKDRLKNPLLAGHLFSRVSTDSCRFFV